MQHKDSLQAVGDRSDCRFEDTSAALLEGTTLAARDRRDTLIQAAAVVAAGALFGIAV